MKYRVSSRVKLKNDVEAVVTQRDPGTGRYMVKTENGRERGVYEDEIVQEIPHTQAKRSIFHRK